MTSMHESGYWPAHQTFANVSIVHNVAPDPSDPDQPYPVGSKLEAQAQRNGSNAENVAMVTVELPAGVFVTVWADGTVQLSNVDNLRNYRADTANLLLGPA